MLRPLQSTAAIPNLTGKDKSALAAYVKKCELSKAENETYASMLQKCNEKFSAKPTWQAIAFTAVLGIIVGVGIGAATK